MILDTIVARKRQEVSQLRAQGISLPAEFKDRAIDRPRGFRNTLLAYPGVSVIAEVKKASPSKGLICSDFQPVDIAKNYHKNGAQAISVLTDADFFQGSLLYLMQVREAVPLPILRKDFIIDALQIEEAHAHGADAILLIAAILTCQQMQDYQAQALGYGIDVLVEVHDEWETEQALLAGSQLVGINNRNLKTFIVDLETTFRLRKLIPPEIPVVSESGLKTVEDFRRLKQEGIKAALIGETLMRAGADSSLLRNLRE